MKYFPLSAIVFSLVASFICWGGFNSGLIFFLAWIALPMFFSIVMAVLNIREIYFSQTLPIVGALASLLVLFPYCDVYSYEGGDGQVALIFVVVPIYQFAFIGLMSALWNISKRFK